MKNLLDKIDSRVITSAGGILLAGILAYGLLKIFTNDLTHINTSIENQNTIMAQIAEIVKGNTSAIEKNTDVLRELKGRIR